MTDLRGRCHCGAVTYAVAGDVKRVVNCHCNMCRSMNGTAFSSYAIVNRADLSIVQGRDSLRQYAVTDSARKHYCSECGSPLFNTNVARYGDHAMLYLGILTDPGDLPDPVNIFHDDRLGWTDSVAGLTSFARLPRQ